MAGRSTATVVERILRRVVVDPSGCWLWPGATRPSQWGDYGHAGGSKGGVKYDVITHRAIYEYFIGPIPEGWHVDHLCRVTLCCFPDHLEAVTPLENSLRSANPAFVAHITDTCYQGHSLLDAYVSQRTGYRTCRTCSHERAVARWAARAA